MRRLAALVAVGFAAGCGSGSEGTTVHADGRIGSVQIDESTEAQVREFAGKPLKVDQIDRGHELYYRCGPGCVTTYAISDATHKLSDFNTQSPQFVTERGSHVGMPAAKAAAAERRKVVGGCGEGHHIQVRWDRRHMYVLGVFAGKVSLIAYLGPHTLSDEGLC